MSMFGYRKETEIDVNININILYHKGAQKDRYSVKKKKKKLIHDSEPKEQK